MVSILMPIYNGIEFINESVGSILSQTYKEWELIIGINGHPENSETYQIAKKYETEYPQKIRVIDFYNIKGKGNTLNVMLSYCKYNYVALLDVDDIWNDNKLEIQSSMLNHYDVIGTRCVYFGDLNGIVPDIPTGDISSYNFMYCNPIINSSSIIRKELCYWDDTYMGVEDYDLWLRLRIQQKRFYVYSDILVYHRIHQTSAFNSKGNHEMVNNLLQKYAPYLQQI